MYFDQALKEIATLLSSIEKKDMKNVIEDMFTPSEICEVGERILLLKELMEGKTQREIASDLGISVTTVSRGARVLKYGKGLIKNYL